jgi:hypothetical protein
MRDKTAEHERLLESRPDRLRNWRLWGPYLSERQWGTVREDYSADGNAWAYFPHDHARSRAYRWGEDGLAGLCDDQQELCLALALWNGRDPILKERLFGLTNNEGNHGEDVKELYYYLDATPTSSYLRMLYKYPQAEFPYARLLDESRRRSRGDPEFELIETGVFDEDRYFDITVEYVKAAPDDVLMLITVANRGPEAAVLHVLPQLWFRSKWLWKPDRPKPELIGQSDGSILARHDKLGEYTFFADGSPALLFCDNLTNVRRLYGVQDAQGWFKDAFHDFVIGGRADAINPHNQGTKAAAHYVLDVEPGGRATVRVRLAAMSSGPPFEDFQQIFDERRHEADEYWSHFQTGITDEDARRVQRQALAGLLWSKQFYDLDIREWLTGDPGQPPPPPERRVGRNSGWTHLNNSDILSMPDTWEYPWYAAWDLAFHCIPLSLIDPEFAKEQILLLTREWYMHPSGQLPAYEWEFGDVNPPVHAWAAWRVFQIDRKQRGGTGDLAFLEKVFHKSMLNFTWWVNRKDVGGRNIFQGGFLGLDNIGVFDRSKPLPMGGTICQSDGTSWMAMYSLNLMRIALELARHNHVYEDVATKFFEHFLYIAEAMTNLGGQGISLWDEEDEFFYDVLSLPDGGVFPLKIRSMVGLIPLFAVETIEPQLLRKLPDFATRLEWFLHFRPDLAGLVSRWHIPGTGDRRLLSLLRGRRMKSLLRRMLDETEFLSDYGIRALSRVHRDHPYVFTWDGQATTVGYEPGESGTGLFGGNSSWRGPVWMPMNFLIIESLQKFHYYYGDDFKIECPTGSGRHLTIDQVAAELTRRLSRIFLRNDQGRRPFYGADERMQTDPHFRDHILFYEYFHGDTGRGLGASHQTGWTALVAKLLQPRAGYWD